MWCKHLWHVHRWDRQDIQESPDGLVSLNGLKNKKWPMGIEMCFSQSTLKLSFNNQHLGLTHAHSWQPQVSWSSLQVPTGLCISPSPLIQPFILASIEGKASVSKDHWLSYTKALLIASDLIICGGLTFCQVFSRWWTAVLLLYIIHHQLKVNTKLSTTDSPGCSGWRTNVQTDEMMRMHKMSYIFERDTVSSRNH